MAAIGSAVRARTGARVVAITGSVGKTSTKDILTALLRPHVRVVAAEAGFNNEIGLPLTLARIEQDTEVVVTELGMRGAGEIRALAAIARPHVGVITAIAPVHLELLGSVENVARAKAELLEALPPGGIAIVPADAPALRPCVRALRRPRDRVLLRGPSPGVERSRGTHRVRSARSPAPGRGRRGVVLEVALGGERAAGRRPPRQRRVECEPGRDARSTPVPRRAGCRSQDDRDPRRNG